MHLHAPDLTRSAAPIGRDGTGQNQPAGPPIISRDGFAQRYARGRDVSARMRARAPSARLVVFQAQLHKQGLPVRPSSTAYAAVRLCLWLEQPLAFVEPL